MKKIMYLATALLVLAGCNKNSQENKENAPANYGTITGKIELPQTPNKIVAPGGWKALSEAFTMQWESTDKIYIYNQSECKELTVKSIDAQTGNATFAGELLTDMTSYKVAYGYNPTAGATAFAVDYIADNYRPFAAGTGEYSIFTIDDFGPVMGFKLKGTAKVGKIEVIASKSSAAQATYTMTLATAIELNATTPTVVYFPLNDLGDADKLEAKFYQESILAKTQAFVTLPAKNMVTTYPAIEVNGTAPAPTYEYVDLGLTVNWATFNVGATKPEEYGDYFAWGEKEPYYNTPLSNPISWKEGKDAGYNWASYFDAKDDGSTFLKYNLNGGKTTLDPEDDAAHVNWGGSWRMPTKAEWDELKSNCSWERTNNYNNTGVVGYIVKSKAQGNTSSIFLPAAGLFVLGEGESDTYAKELRNTGIDGYYWSSGMRVNYYPRYTYCMCFVYYDDFIVVTETTRRNGISIRPVCPKEE